MDFPRIEAVRAGRAAAWNKESLHRFQSPGRAGMQPRPAGAPLNPAGPNTYAEPSSGRGGFLAAGALCGEAPDLPPAGTAGAS